MDSLKLEPGRPWPMGASVTAEGVNFAVFSAHAQSIDLCLFDEAGQRLEARLGLPGRSGDVHHGFLRGARAGLVYGLRAEGPWAPEQGHVFNPHKLLLDPWAREIVGLFEWDSRHFGADRRRPGEKDLRDNASLALKARVVDDRFDWQGDAPLRRPLQDTVLYELHVRGFTRRMRAVPEPLRGTYPGLGSPAALAHLQRLGITAVSLLPVHQHLDEERLCGLGLSNYWGYNTIGFFCPEPRYASRPDGATARDEFRRMVQALHRAGIEVILDVVFNHTAEAGETGPTLSMRGLDQRSWYRMDPAHPGRCENYSGCGNTLNVQHPRVLQMVLDSLRYWVQEMHVDGFRFDLAPVLGRHDGGFDGGAAFFKAVAQDPALAGIKLIAEPWDLGPGGYRLGGFPPGWLEWNDQFRDTVRKFWLGGDVTRGEFARRLAGSADLFERDGRSPMESVNYAVSHDGFTMRDLLSHDVRHNEANLEDNRDGHGHNLSWNCGWEGPTTDPQVLRLRQRLHRALLATVLLSQGTPMLAAGDELGHSQRGNNNPYCQDNEISWIDWSRADAELVAYTAHLIRLRHRLLPLAPVWYTGQPDADGRADLTWLRRTGEPLQPEEWNNRGSRILAAWIGRPGRGGDPLLLIFNAREFDAELTLPPGRWTGELDSAEPDGIYRQAAPQHGRLLLSARSVVLLRDDRRDDPSVDRAGDCLASRRTP